MKSLGVYENKWVCGIILVSIIELTSYILLALLKCEFLKGQIPKYGVALNGTELLRAGSNRVTIALHPCF